LPELDLARGKHEHLTGEELLPTSVVWTRCRELGGEKTNGEATQGGGLDKGDED